jgi:hypothetical protein
MYRLLGILCFNAFVFSALAAVEDGDLECSDGIDNDFDGATDCAEPACVSSRETCGLLPGPISVGLGSDKAYLTFDVPMITKDGAIQVSDALVLDINGSAIGRDDVIVPRPGTMNLFRNIVSAGYTCCRKTSPQ